MTAEVQVQEEVVRRDEPQEDGLASEVPSEEVAPQKENGIEPPSPPAEEPTTEDVKTSEEPPPAPASTDAPNHRKDEPLENGHASEETSEEVTPQKENGIEPSSPPAEEPTTEVVVTSEEPGLDTSHEHDGHDGHHHRKVMSMTQIDRDGLRDAYSDVRDDKSDVNWAVFKYEGSQVVVAAKGDTFDEFKSQFGEDERAFAYIRLQTGDEMSKRSKFLLVTWVGLGVSPIKKAKMSTDKALVKEILANFAVELTLESTAELDHDAFLQELVKAGGANYGTGVRD